MHGMNRRAYAPANSSWHLISLRPSGQHDGLRRAAARLGGRTVAVSPWRLQPRDDPQTRQLLLQAQRYERVVFTSPAAAAAAAALMPLQQLRAGSVVAVGQGTARALYRHGAKAVHAPTRMDSEGLLALPSMAGLHGKQVALVTAPGGRGMIAAQLQAQGAQLQRIDVYERQPLAIPAATLARLQALAEPIALAVSSGEALQRVVAQLPAALLQRWQQEMAVVVASARLAELATGLGFTRVHLAAGPLPAQLVAAAHAALFAAAG